MVAKLPIKHYKTHTTAKIYGETIPTVILPRSLQDQPSPSKFGKIHQCGTSQFKFYVGVTYLVITHEVPHPQSKKYGSLSQEHHVLTILKYKK